jgi:hypothetical protein
MAQPLSLKATLRIKLRRLAMVRYQYSSSQRFSRLRYVRHAIFLLVPAPFAYLAGLCLKDLLLEHRFPTDLSTFGFVMLTSFAVLFAEIANHFLLWTRTERSIVKILDRAQQGVE